MNINWKYILIVLILAIIAGGGIFWWSIQQDILFTESISIKTQEYTSNWKTYQNEEYGFELRYPQDWKHEPGFPLTGERLSVVYKPEESQCGQGVGCFYPGQFFVGPILKSDLLPKQKDANIPFAQYTQECIKELWEPGATLSTRNLTINGHSAIEISTITKKEGPASVFVPDMTILIEYSPTTVIWIEIRYFPEYKDYVLSTYKTIFSTFKFIDQDGWPWVKYTNKQVEYGFEFKYPKDYILKEVSSSSPYILLRKAEGGEFDWLVRIQGEKNIIGGNYDTSKMSFDEFAANEIRKSCAADGPTGSQYCTEVVKQEPFTVTNQTEGYKFYINEVNIVYKGQENETSEKIIGPIFVLDVSQQSDNAIRGLFFQLTDIGEESIEKENLLKILNQMLSTFRFLE